MATPHLNCHPASPEEQVQTYRDVFPVWPHAETLDAHVQLRLASAQHNRARWFVGCVGDQVVVSLGCYPMQFRIRGEVVPGMALGAVHTVPEWRGQGFAPTLIRWVENQQAQQGVKISLLFSDIAPNYYTRLGYRLCPAWEGWCDISASPMIPTNPIEFIPFQPQEQIEECHRYYLTQHRDLAFSIHRDEDYWNYLFQKTKQHQWCWVMERSQCTGYTCVRIHDGNITVSDGCWPREKEADIYQGLIHFAREQGCRRVGGWLAETRAAAKCFSLSPRKQEITMLKSLTPERKIDLEMEQHSGSIHEIDHV